MIVLLEFSPWAAQETEVGGVGQGGACPRACRQSVAKLDWPPFSGPQAPTVFPLPWGPLQPRGPMGKIKKDASGPLKYFFFFF